MTTKATIKYLFKRVNPLIGHNVNGQWGHRQAKVERRFRRNDGFRMAIHRGYCAFFIRRGKQPECVPCHELEYPADLIRWANHMH